MQFGVCTPICAGTLETCRSKPDSSGSATNEDDFRLRNGWMARRPSHLQSDVAIRGSVGGRSTGFGLRLNPPVMDGSRQSGLLKLRPVDLQCGSVYMSRSDQCEPQMRETSVSGSDRAGFNVHGVEFCRSVAGFSQILTSFGQRFGCCEARQSDKSWHRLLHCVEVLWSLLHGLQ